MNLRGIFGSTVSPLRHLGGGGILQASDVDYLHANGADAVSIGTVGIIRPWRVKGIIERAKQLFGGE